MRPSHEQVCAVTSLDRKIFASRRSQRREPQARSPGHVPRNRQAAPPFQQRVRECQHHALHPQARCARTNDDRVAASRPLHPQPVCRQIPPPKPTLRRAVRSVTQGWSGDHPRTQLRVPCFSSLNVDDTYITRATWCAARAQVRSVVAWSPPLTDYIHLGLPSFWYWWYTRLRARIVLQHGRLQLVAAGVASGDC